MDFSLDDAEWSVMTHPRMTEAKAIELSSCHQAVTIFKLHLILVQ
jgi:hypothetical protein